MVESVHSAFFLSLGGCILHGRICAVCCTPKKKAVPGGHRYPRSRWGTGEWACVRSVERVLEAGREEGMGEAVSLVSRGERSWGAFQSPRRQHQLYDSRT